MFLGVTPGRSVTTLRNPPLRPEEEADAGCQHADDHGTDRRQGVVAIEPADRDRQPLQHRDKESGAEAQDDDGDERGPQGDTDSFREELEPSDDPSGHEPDQSHDHRAHDEVGPEVDDLEEPGGHTQKHAAQVDPELDDNLQHKHHQSGERAADKSSHCADPHRALIGTPADRQQSEAAKVTMIMSNPSRTYAVDDELSLNRSIIPTKAR